MNLILTDAACAYLRQRIEKEQGVGFRLSIKKTGCSGYTYLPSVINQINPNDTLFEINQLSIYIDTAWLDLFDGVTIDYIIEDKTGLKQKRLLFINPKETARCGCGESFHIEKS